MTLSNPTYNELLKTAPVFEWNYHDPTKIKINQGGTSSTKTYSLLQVIFMRLIESPEKIATVVGQDIPNLKKGALRDFKDRILPQNPWMRNYITNYHKTDRVYTFNNGSIMEFTSYKDPQDAQSGKRNILFMNEANGMPWGVYEQLALRTSDEIFLDYNPTAEFWAHERLMQRHDSVTFYSNFTHNPFIDESVKEYILSLRHTDDEAWRVYGLGKTGAVSDVCIENITIVDKMPRALKRRGLGLDFGYRAHPSALINCGLLNERDVFLDELFYVYRMKTRDMDIFMNAINVPRHRRICADEAEPRSIDDLADRGWNIEGVTKGKHSVLYGLELLNQYNLHVTERSINMINERKKYVYKIDKKTGKVLNEPVDAFNHAWDAARYWAMRYLRPLRPTKYTYSGEVV